MAYRGHVKKEPVVLDDPAALPDGLEVRIEPVVRLKQKSQLDENGLTLGQKLLKHAGKAIGLPPDLAANHDRYPHGSLDR